MAKLLYCPSKDMKLAIPIVLLIALVVLILMYDTRTRRICKFICKPRFQIDTVRLDEFSEKIPQTGIVVIDSSLNSNFVLDVDVDKLYLHRITVGLIGVTTINNEDYILNLMSVDTVLREGRFKTKFNFSETTPSLSPGESVRLRIQLSTPRQSLLVPVGGFCKDTGGKWIYGLNKSGLLIKRNIILGAKNTEHFQVLDGLEAGDIVITSSYEQFMNRDNLHVDEIKRMFE